MYLWNYNQKFLGFYLIERAIDVKPNKCEALINMASGITNKEVMKLNGMHTTIHIFISRSHQHALPFYSFLKIEAHFERFVLYEQTFISLNSVTDTPVLCRSVIMEVLSIYLVVSTEVVSVLIIREIDSNQNPVYFISKTMAKP